MSSQGNLPPVPRFVYGTAWKEDATRRCVEDALEAGFRGIDTANQRMHYYEAGVGEALQSACARGVVTRADVFLQTKFTPRDGQDQRLPYDGDAPLTTQVEQSLVSSLAHLGVDTLDSYVLHGPATATGLNDEDWETWRAMEAAHQAGKVRYLGVSNVDLEQLRVLHEGAAIKPSFVQNRCFARTLWDRDIRAYCRAQGLIYQGFSLLTANTESLRSAAFREIVERTGNTPAQVVFRFALDIGILPLTGTTDPSHMREDLQALELELSKDDVAAIERLAASGQ